MKQTNPQYTHSHAHAYSDDDSGASYDVHAISVREIKRHYLMRSSSLMYAIIAHFKCAICFILVISPEILFWLRVRVRMLEQVSVCVRVSTVHSDSVCTGMWSEERCELAIAHTALTLTNVAFPHIYAIPLLVVIVGTPVLYAMYLPLWFRVYRFVLSSLLAVAG